MKIQLPRFQRRKGFVWLFVVFVFFSIVLTFLFAFGVPMLMSWDVNIYNAGQTILQSIDTSKISDPNIRANISGTLNDSIASIPDQINILGYFFRYGWFIVIFIVTLVLYLWSRQLVEYTQGGVS